MACLAPPNWSTGTELENNNNKKLFNAHKNTLNNHPPIQMKMLANSVGNKRQMFHKNYIFEASPVPETFDQ